MTTIEILSIEFEAIRKDLIAKHEQLGMKASGKWADSLEVKIIGNNDKSVSQIIGENYTEQLAFGRSPGKFPPIKAIEKWIYDKGISLIGKKITVSSLAFLIARKIAREGTKYFKQGGTDLIEAVITPERIEKIISQVKEINVTTFTNGLIEQLKQVA
jgi:hypothetical protein